jgi:hypothetical protein
MSNPFCPDGNLFGNRLIKNKEIEEQEVSGRE